MKIAIFGATGRTGRLIVEKALAEGHEVVAFVRNPARLTIQHERLTAVQGDVSRAADVERAIDGADAVITSLTPHEEGMGNILGAMRRCGVQRLISATGAGVGDPNDNGGAFHRFMTWLVKTVTPQAYWPAVKQVEAIRAADDLDWTIVRATVLSNKPGTGSYDVGYITPSMKPTLSREDLADFMLKQVTDTAWVRKAPVVRDR
jgi:putative NADH-flavin reductase